MQSANPNLDTATGSTSPLDVQDENVRQLITLIEAVFDKKRAIEQAEQDAAWAPICGTKLGTNFAVHFWPASARKRTTGSGRLRK